jgi:hypothetical protein
MERLKKKSVTSSGFRFRRDVVWRKIGNRGVVVQTKKAKILVLNETAADVLHFVEKGLNEEEIVKEMTKIYSGDRKRMRKEIEVFIRELLDRGVIEKK